MDSRSNAPQILLIPRGDGTTMTMDRVTSAKWRSTRRTSPLTIFLGWEISAPGMSAIAMPRICEREDTDTGTYPEVGRRKGRFPIPAKQWCWTIERSASTSMSYSRDLQRRARKSSLEIDHPRRARISVICYATLSFVGVYHRIRWLHRRTCCQRCRDEGFCKHGIFPFHDDRSRQVGAFHRARWHRHASDCRHLSRRTSVEDESATRAGCDSCGNRNPSDFVHP